MYVENFAAGQSRSTDKRTLHRRLNMTEYVNNRSRSHSIYRENSYAVCIVTTVTNRTCTPPICDLQGHPSHVHITSMITSNHSSGHLSSTTRMRSWSSSARPSSDDSESLKCSVAPFGAMSRPASARMDPCGGRIDPRTGNEALEEVEPRLLCDVLPCNSGVAVGRG